MHGRSQGRTSMDKDAFSEVVRWFESKVDVRVHSYKYNILMTLYAVGCASPRELIGYSRASSASFYEKIKTLEADRKIWSQPDAKDRRVKLYQLTDHTRHVMDEEFAFLPQWFSAKLHDLPMEERGFKKFSIRLEKRLGIHQFSSEYQILINLYDSGELSAGDLLATSNVSATKFYLSLRKLHAQGLLLTGRDDRDKRKVRYRLTDQLRANIDETHRRVSAWFQPMGATETSD